MTNNKSEQLILLPAIILTVLVVLGCFKMVSWCIVLPLAVLMCIRRPADKRVFRISFLDVSLLLICAAELAASIYSGYVPKSVDACARVTGIVTLWFYMRYFITDRSQVAVMIKTLLLTSLVMAVITMITYLKHRAAFMEMGYTDLTPVRQYYRPLGIISNDWTAILICLLPASLTLILRNGNIYVRILGLLTFIAMNVVILVSFSRGGYVSLFFFYLTAFGAILLFHRKVMVKFICIAACTLTISLGSVMMSDKESVLTTLSLNRTTVQHRSTDARLGKWQEAVDLFKSRPYLGYGSGNYQQASALYGKKEYNALSFRSTNSYLQVLAEKGLLGGICYLIGIVAFIVRSVVSARKNVDTIPFIAAFAALLVHEFFFSSIFENNCLPLLTIIIMFLSVYPVCRYEKKI
ncbi:MAG: O-antigen ligase family protein [Bacteroidaceae bacterium]|nr:O-antigen ligase family protein [Bacteroidaceae bacterium]